MPVDLALRLVTVKHVQMPQLALVAHPDTLCQAVLVQHVLRSIIVSYALMVQPAPAVHQATLFQVVLVQHVQHQSVIVRVAQMDRLALHAHLDTT
jgi:hypothetical protein